MPLFTLLMRENGLSLERRLAGHPFTAGLLTPAVKTLAGMARELRLNPGEYLWRQGQHTDSVYLIDAGQIAFEILVPNSGPLRIETVEGGEVIGASWLLAPHRWPFDARAINEVTAIVLDGGCLRRHCEDHPGFGYLIFKRLAPRLAQGRQKDLLRILELSRA